MSNHLVCSACSVVIDDILPPDRGDQCRWARLLLEESARRAMRAGIQTSDLHNAVSALAVEITMVKTRAQRAEFISGRTVAEVGASKRR